MTKGEKNKVHINFSKIFHVTFDLDELVHENFASATFFLANSEGQIITMREVGGFVPGIIEVIYRLANKLVTEPLPIKDKDYLIDALPITLHHNDQETWEGYFGAILSVDEGSPEIIRSLLLGFKQSLIMTANYLEYKQKLESYRRNNKVEQMISNLLKETDYTNDFPLFAQSFLDKLKEMVNVGEFVLLFLNQNENLLISRFSTMNSIALDKEKYVIGFSDMTKALQLLEKDQIRVMTKDFVQQNQISSFEECFDDFIFIPLERDGNLFTVLVYGIEKGRINTKIINSILDLLTESERLFYKLFTFEKDMQDQKRKELLLQVTKKFHSSMDVSAILAEIIHALKEVFPFLIYDFYYLMNGKSVKTYLLNS